MTSQCICLTVKKARCRNNTSNESKKCFQHFANANCPFGTIHPASITTKTESSIVHPASFNKCICLKKNREPCNNYKRQGSEMCFSHRLGCPFYRIPEKFLQTESQETRQQLEREKEEKLREIQRQKEELERREEQKRQESKHREEQSEREQARQREELEKEEQKKQEAKRREDLEKEERRRAEQRNQLKQKEEQLQQLQAVIQKEEEREKKEEEAKRREEQRLLHEREQARRRKELEKEEQKKQEAKHREDLEKEERRREEQKREEERRKEEQKQEQKNQLKQKEEQLQQVRAAIQKEEERQQRQKKEEEQRQQKVKALEEEQRLKAEQEKRKCENYLEGFSPKQQAVLNRCKDFGTNMRMVTIPEGKSVSHSKKCRFPPPRKYPYYTYNWYKLETQPFSWPDDDPYIAYFYRIKKPIPNILQVHLNKDQTTIEAMDKFLLAIDPTYQPAPSLKKEPSGDDYRQPAYLCQVLGWNGILFDNELVLCGNGSNWLQYEYEEVLGTPAQCEDLTGKSLPQGSDRESSIQKPKLGVHFFQDHQIEQHRKEVRKHFPAWKTWEQKEKLGYLEIGDANREAGPHSETKIGTGKLSVFTLNVQDFESCGARGHCVQNQALVAFLQEHKPDVICTQEDHYYEHTYDYNRKLKEVKTGESKPFVLLPPDYGLVSSCEASHAKKRHPEAIGGPWKLANNIYIQEHMLNGHLWENFKITPLDNECNTNRCASGLEINGFILVNVHLCGGRFDDKKKEQHLRAKQEEIANVLTWKPDLIIGDFNAEHKVTYNLDQVSDTWKFSHLPLLDKNGYLPAYTRQQVGPTSAYGPTVDWMYYDSKKTHPIGEPEMFDTLKEGEKKRLTDHNGVFMVFQKGEKQKSVEQKAPSPAEQKAVEKAVAVEKVVEKTVEQHITIDDIEFKVESCCKKDVLNREIMKVNSKTVDGKEETFCVYRSNSETGLWRLYVVLQGSYWKGTNYVTSSFINMELQLFLNEYSKKSHQFPLLTEADAMECNQKMGERLAVLYEPTYSNSDEPVFLALESCKPGDCFKSSDNVTAAIQRINDLLPASMKQTVAVGDVYSLLRSFYDASSLLLERNFSLVDNSNQYLGKQEFEYTGKKFRVVHNFYSVVIESNHSKKKFTVIYSKYTLTMRHSPRFDGEHFIIVNILPQNTRVTPVGIYNQAMDVGPIVYKMFEYASQCPIGTKDRSIPGSEGCYAYIGDLQENVWPLPQVKKLFQKKGEIVEEFKKLGPLGQQFSQVISGEEKMNAFVQFYDDNISKLQKECTSLECSNKLELFSLLKTTTTLIPEAEDWLHKFKTITAGNTLLSSISNVKPLFFRISTGRYYTQGDRKPMWILALLAARGSRAPIYIVGDEIGRPLFENLASWYVGMNWRDKAHIVDLYSEKFRALPKGIQFASFHPVETSLMKKVEIEVDFGDNATTERNRFVSCLLSKYRPNHRHFGSLYAPLQYDWSDAETLDELRRFRASHSKIACMAGSQVSPVSAPEIIDWLRQSPDWSVVLVGWKWDTIEELVSNQRQVLIISHVQYEDVVKQVDFFITNCGAGSVTVALAAGCPQQCSSFVDRTIGEKIVGNDKSENQRAIESLHVGPKWDDHPKTSFVDRMKEVDKNLDFYKRNAMEAKKTMDREFQHMWTKMPEFFAKLSSDVAFQNHVLQNGIPDEYSLGPCK
jgi:hypothetical protein